MLMRQVAWHAAATMCEEQDAIADPVGEEQTGDQQPGRSARAL